jgi:hypothetical protein
MDLIIHPNGESLKIPMVCESMNLCILFMTSRSGSRTDHHSCVTITSTGRWANRRSQRSPPSLQLVEEIRQK